MIEDKCGNTVIPSSPADRQKLKMMIEEITHCMARMDAERDCKKDIVSKIHEEFSIPKKIVTKIASTMYKHNYSDVQAEYDDFESLYETLINSNPNLVNDNED